MTAKIALITGANRGIGQAILLTLGASEVFVIGTATTDKGANHIAQNLKKNNLKGTGIILNVTDDEQIKQVITTIDSKYGSIDILVNNAGIIDDSLLIRMADEQWHNIINTNLNSVYKLSKAVLRGMMKKHFGRIISIASVVGTMGNVGQTNYAAAKAGIIGFSKSLAREVGSRNITVNTIAPGFIKTDMTNAMSEEKKLILQKQIPLARLGMPEEIADAVAFLASDKAAYITAQTLHINGGMYTV